MRSLLFVPGDSERKLAKGVESGADCLLIDLEDSVAPDRKAAARAMAAEFVAGRRGAGGPLIYVRVNDLGTGLTDADLAAIVPARPDGIMLPKANSWTALDHVGAMLRVREAEAGVADGATRIMAIITETAAGLLAANTWRQPHPRLAGVSWGAEDLSADIGTRAARDADGRYTDVFLLARSATILAAAACQTSAIDTVFVDFRDTAGLRQECLEAERDGFTAKLAIHPAQVETINQCFTPSDETIAEAQAVVDAFAAAGNPGVVGIGGKMYDMPHLKRAERLLARIRKT